MGQLESMVVFAKAAEAGSFAAAGLALGLSAQMVGKHVGEIEARLGARLLNRTTRRQSLTEVGRLYLERCKAVLAEVEAADAVAQSLTEAPRGLLRVSAPLTFGTHGLMPLVSRYLQQHPEVQVDLTLTDRLVDLEAEGFEATVRIGMLGDANMVSRERAPWSPAQRWLQRASCSVRIGVPWRGPKASTTMSMKARSFGVIRRSLWNSRCAGRTGISWSVSSGCNRPCPTAPRSSTSAPITTPSPSTAACSIALESLTWMRYCTGASCIRPSFQNGHVLALGRRPFA